MAASVVRPPQIRPTFRKQGEHSVNRHLAIFALAVAGALGATAVHAQAQPAPAAAPAARATAPASHSAVIDVGYIFKNHARF
jgi:hypothetical protein